jgi:hypothetical protein
MLQWLYGVCEKYWMGQHSLGGSWLEPWLLQDAMMCLFTFDLCKWANVWVGATTREMETIVWQHHLPRKAPVQDRKANFCWGSSTVQNNVVDYYCSSKHDCARNLRLRSENSITVVLILWIYIFVPDKEAQEGPRYRGAPTAAQSQIKNIKFPCTRGKRSIPQWHWPCVGYCQEALHTPVLIRKADWSVLSFMCY